MVHFGIVFNLYGHGIYARFGRELAAFRRVDVGCREAYLVTLPVAMHHFADKGVRIAEALVGHFHLAGL